MKILVDFILRSSGSGSRDVFFPGAEKVEVLEDRLQVPSVQSSRCRRLGFVEEPIGFHAIDQVMSMLGARG